MSMKLKGQKEKNCKMIITFLVFFLSLIIFLKLDYVNAFARDEQGNIVVVIDPGHGCAEGGENTGAASKDNAYVEKEVNIVVAKAMKTELETYEGVKVYLTHENPTDTMSIAARARFAEGVNADFVFSIHFNASDNYDKYGSEVWIPSVGSYYVAGKQFAAIELFELEKIGLFNRGIKTRIGDDEDEYYGIIRECEWKNINAVIIEHCYIDSKEDINYITETGSLERFGKIDATAVAKYFGLKGQNGDYTNYERLQVDEPAARVYQDKTAPDICILSVDNESTNNGNLSMVINAIDSDGAINYYSYSLDGGETFSRLFTWFDPDEDDKMPIMIDNIQKDSANVIVRVYNQYDNYTESNEVKVNGIGGKKHSSIRESVNKKRKYIFKILKWMLHNRIMIATIVLVLIGIFATKLILKLGKRVKK